MWPQIRTQTADATLDIYYGWNGWPASREEAKSKMKCALEDLKNHGVTEHGRVGHNQLALEMESIQIWAYPTEMPEIFCITALKAQQARCFPVVTNVGAFSETVQSGVLVDCQNIYSNAVGQSQFVQAVVEGLSGNALGVPMLNCDWSDVADQWISNFE